MVPSVCLPCFHHRCTALAAYTYVRTAPSGNPPFDFHLTQLPCAFFVVACLAGKHVGQYTVFNAHDELIHMFELAAANMSHRSIRRILKGVPMENYLRPPSKVDYAGSLLRMRVGDILLPPSLPPSLLPYTEPCCGYSPSHYYTTTPCTPPDMPSSDTPLEAQTKASQSCSSPPPLHFLPVPSPGLTWPRLASPRLPSPPPTPPLLSPSPFRPSSMTS
jgi:hypothetical protein